MKKGTAKNRLRSFLTWMLWVVIVQLVLINISAALYAHKITHLKTPKAGTVSAPRSRNVIAKTWRLFTGPDFFKHPLEGRPALSVDSVTLNTKSGLLIRCWHGKLDSAAKGTVIMMHGLTSNKGQVLDEAIGFRNLGFDVFMIDARGHGNSEGESTTIGYYEAEEISIAMNYLKQAGAKNIFLWGTSMGAVAIIKAVAQYDLRPAGIIVEMPFLSLQSHLKGRARQLGFPGEPFGFFTSVWIGVERGFNGLAFRTSKYARKFEGPVLHQYGLRDDLVLKTETDAIFSAFASADKKLVAYEAMHESFYRADPAQWNREVGEFLNR